MPGLGSMVARFAVVSMSRCRQKWCCAGVSDCAKGRQMLTIAEEREGLAGGYFNDEE